MTEKLEAFLTLAGVEPVGCPTKNILPAGLTLF